MVLVVARLLKIPVVCSFHVDIVTYSTLYASEPMYSILKFLIMYFMYWPTIAFKATLMAPTIGNDLQVGFQYTTMVLPTGVNTQLFRPNRQHVRSPYILYVGRLGPEKNLPRLLSLFQKIRRRYRLIIIGSGRMAEELQRVPDKRITWLNQMTQAELVPYYQNATFTTTH